MIFLMIFCVLHNAFAESFRVKRINLGNDQIAEIKTALGIATIIQVPENPNSVVVGDSEAFKVEYLDQAITIKPLYSGAKSNLYIYTDYRRYNVQLVSVNQTEANFIVYLVPAQTLKKKEKPIRSVEPYLSGIKWWKFNSLFKNDDLQLQIRRLGLSSNNVALIDFTISSQKKSEITPSSLILKQNGKVLTIHNLFLSNLKLDSKNSISGTIEVLKSDLQIKSAIRLEMKIERTSYLTLPEVNSWEKLKLSL